MMKTVFDELEELVRTGKYANKEELIEDALRTLLRAKPELRMDLAVELYRKRKVTLLKATEVCGLNVEDFKELLREKGIKIPVPNIPVEEIDKEVERIIES